MSSEEMPVFVVASNKDWHRPLFDELRNDLPGRWLWVSDSLELEDAVAARAPRYVFFLHWSHRVSESIWKQHECICFHMTDLPYGRGGSPLQNLILRGHADTRLTAFRMVEAMDAGPVYAKASLSLEGSAEEIYLRAGRLSADLIRTIIADEPVPAEQTGEPVVFERRRPEQSELPVSGTAKELYDFIRMLDAEGYPHAFTRHGGLTLTYTDAELVNGELTAQVTIASDTTRNRS